MKPLLVGIKNILLWSYERGTWQYDMLCLLIIAAIFVVPSRYFGDRDRSVVAEANKIPAPASNPLVKVWEIELDELQSFLQKQNRIDLINSPQEAIALYLRDQTKRDLAEIGKPELVMTSRGRPAYRVRFR